MRGVLRTATAAMALAAAMATITTNTEAAPLFESLWTGFSENTRVNAVSDDGSTVVGVRNGSAYLNRLGIESHFGSPNNNSNVQHEIFDSNYDGTHLAGMYNHSGASWILINSSLRLRQHGRGFDNLSISGNGLVIGAEEILRATDNRGYLVDATTPDRFNAQLIGSGAPTGLSDDGRAASISLGYRSDFPPTAHRWSEANGIEDFSSFLSVDLQQNIQRSESLNISNDGAVVVGYYQASNQYSSFVWTEAGYAELPRILEDASTAGEYQAANAVTQSGEVVVGTDAGQAYVWTAGAGTRALKELLEVDYGLDLTGWILEEAVDITFDGTKIVGNGINPEGERTVWAVSNLPAIVAGEPPSPVSEPGTLALLGVGLIGLGLGLRRKLA